MKTMSMLNINVVGLIFGGLMFGGAYIWNVVSVSICGGLILGGGAYIWEGGAIFGMG